jgi:ATP-dependent RNA helicase DDX31/DBP7
VALTAVLLAQLEAAARKIIVFVSTADATEFMYLLFSRLRSPFDSAKPDPAAALQVRGRVASNAMHAGSGYGRKKDTERANRHVRDGGAAEEMSGAGGGGIETAIADAKRRAMESLAAKTSGSGNLADEDALLRSNVFKLHGNMTQVDRSSVFNAFRTCEKGVLFCTDVAARGLDMPAVSWIIHYDPPTDDRSYIHRIGRTARIGSIGDSLLMLMEHERAFVPEYLSQATNSQIREKPLSVLMYHLSRIDNNAPSWADSAAKLQAAAANLVKYDEVLNRVALFAYRSMIRAYAAYPRDVRRFFDQSQLHLGHVAASFAIDATPTALRRAGQKHVTEDRNLGRDRTRFRKEGTQIQLDTHDKYRSTLATKASRETKDWLEAKRAEGSLYKPMGHSSTAEFDA